MSNRILNTRSILTLSALAVATVTSVSVMAKDVTVSASATVNNVVDLNKTADLDFGVIRTTGSATALDIATLTIPANPSTAISSAASGVVGATAIIQSLDASTASPASFTIAGVPTFTALTLTLPADNAVSLTSPAGGNTFTLTNFKAYVVTTDEAVAGTALLTQAFTDLEFNVGATLATVVGADAAAAVYQNGDFTANFTVTVDY